MPLITDNTAYFYLYLLDISSWKLVFISFTHFVLRLFIFQLLIYNNMYSDYGFFLEFLRTYLHQSEKQVPRNFSNYSYRFFFFTFSSFIFNTDTTYLYSWYDVKN